MKLELNPNLAVLLVDVQNDFCPGGKLAVPGGNEVVEPLNRVTEVARTNGVLITASRDWHPRETKHFDAWPEHCVKDTEGAKFHPGLNLEGAIIFSKGVDPEADGYSPFEGTSDEGKTLHEIYKEAQINTLLIGGLATDYCVKAAALEAVVKGYETYVLLDAIRAVNLKDGDGEKALAEMELVGVKFRQTTDIKR